MSGLALQLVLMGLEKAAASRDSPTAVMLGKSHAQRAIYEAAFVSSPAKLQAAHMQRRGQLPPALLQLQWPSSVPIVVEDNGTNALLANDAIDLLTNCCFWLRQTRPTATAVCLDLSANLLPHLDLR